MHRRKTKAVVGVVALATAGALAVTGAPAVSAPEPANVNDAPNMGPGMGPGPRHGWRRAGRPERGPWHGDGSCRAGLPAKGTVTEAQQATLSWLTEEEKVAHDLYVALGDKFGDRRFLRIARSETNHLRAMRVVLQRYDIADPTKGLAPGSFTSQRAQSTYDQSLAQGRASLKAALAVGKEVERADIVALKAARADIEAPDVDRVVTHLLRASRMHLRAFAR